MRPEGRIKAGQYLCPTPVITMIASHLAPAPDGVRAADPFAAQGLAMAALCEQVGIPRSHRYLAELQAADAEAATAVADHVVCTDTFRGLRCSPEMVGLLYSNPPFDYQGWIGRNEEREQATSASERDELRALKVLLNKTRQDILQAGGIHVFIAPARVMAMPDTAAELMRWHDAWSVFAFPEAHRAFGEAVFFGVKRAMPLHGEEHKAERAAFLARMEYLDELTLADTPRYTLPRPLPIKRLKWRDGLVAQGVIAQQEILKTGGVWATQAWRERQARLSVTAYAPVEKPNLQQVAIALAAGVANNQRAVINGQDVVVKGGTGQKVVTKTAQAVGDGELITTTSKIDIGQPQIALHTLETGEMSVYDGAGPISDLLAQDGAGEALVAAVTAAAPPRYDPQQPNERHWGLVSSIRSQSGRKLPGAKEPGLNTRQTHAVCAALEVLLNPDPRTGKQLRGLFYGWEPRCGKTPSTVTTAEALRIEGLKHPKNHQAAFTSIVVAPTLVVGTRKQVQAWERGDSDEVPTWYATWKDILPHWHIEVLESPAQVAAFFRRTETQREQPHVGIIAMEGPFSLDSGWTVAARDQSGRMWERLERTRSTGEEDVQWNLLHEDSAQDENDDDALEIDFDDSAPSSTQRTRAAERDALLRPTYQPSVYGELVCPDCGRVQRQHDGEEGGQPLPRQAIKSIQHATCQWCGARYAHASRRYTNVHDKRLPVFTRAAAYAENDPHRPIATRRDGTLVSERAIPWGERPVSNPRMALGPMIAKRYRGRIDLLVIDEAHKLKGDSARGRAGMQLISASHRTLALTGTVFGGKAADVFNLMFAMRNPVLVERYGWADRTAFIKAFGLHMEVETKRQAGDGGVYNGKVKTSTVSREIPGLTPALAEMVLAQTISIQLTEMGFQLVPYTEEPVFLDLDGEMDTQYAEAVDLYVETITDAPRAQGSGLQMLLQLPFRSERPKPLIWTDEDGWVHTRTVAPLADRPRPHHAWLAETIIAERRQGRRVLVYCETSGTDDVMEPLAAMVTQCVADRGETLVTRRLYSEGDCQGVKLKAGEREAWFATQAKLGVDVIFCNPRLVEVGVSLLDFPTIVFLQVPYSLFVFDQAKKRPWGPMQTVPVTVYALAYRATASATALNICGKKSAALACLKGDMLSSGVAVFDSGMSLMKSMAAVLNESESGEDEHAIADSWRESSAMVNAAYAQAARMSDPTFEPEADDDDALVDAVLLGATTPMDDAPRYAVVETKTGQQQLAFAL